MDFHPESDRLCSLGMQEKFLNRATICVPAPNEDRDKEQKDAFYDN
jgi:hypothetical protein